MLRGEVIVPVIDSTTAPHANDSRGSQYTGIGSGSIGLEVSSSTGAPIAYYWRGGLSYNAISTPIALGRLATDVNVFPLYEVVDGRYRITRKLGRVKSVDEYLKAQGRFSHLTEDEIAAIQSEVDAKWKRLLELEALG